MRHTRARTGVRPLCTILACIAALLFVTLSNGAFAADTDLATARERLKTIAGTFDRVEATLANADPRSQALVDLRAEIDPRRAELRTLIDQFDPLLTQTQSRLTQLGPPPDANQPAEAPAIAAERAQQTEQVRDIDATLKQARLLLVRADQIVDKIDAQRRAAFTGFVFARAQSIFNPALWLQATAALPGETELVHGLFTEWRNHVVVRDGGLRLGLALVLSAAAIAAILFARRAVRQRIRTQPEGPDAPPLNPSQKALLALRDATLDSLTAPLAALAMLEIFSALDLLPQRIRAVFVGLVTAIAFFAVGRALARAVLSPESPARRLPALGNSAARRLYHLISRTVFVTAIVLLVNVVHHELFSSVALTVALNALYALAVAALIAYALLAGRTTSAEGESDDLPPWIRLGGWLTAVVITAALAAGYIRFASFVAERVVTAAVVFTGLYLLLAIVDALFGEGLTRDSPRRRSLANTLGLRVRTLDLFAALFAGLLRTVLVLIAILLAIGTLTTSVIDLTTAFDRVSLGIQIGQTRILLSDVLAALALLLVGLVLTRILYRWLSNTVLPRTDLEASLQNSIATIAGYAGIIIAASLALGRLGVGLQNIALVAGALSIGIGFGLQSVVSNFVSGLILLTERPIRVGDWIVAKGEEGYVRRISVRSTEIETFERASVILPNSDLITGVVKNWTHADKLGRLSVPVGVSYDSDPDQVRDVLLAAAADHPLVLKAPAPHVLFMKFGDSALEFELRCVVADVNQRLSAGSDLHFEVFKRFRAAGIEIPFPQRDIHIRTVPTHVTDEEPPDEAH